MKINSGNEPNDDERMDFDLASREDGQSVVTVDYERYEHFLEDTDLSETQKREFLEALWRIVVGFVDLGYGVHPVQSVRETCGKLPENPTVPPLTGKGVVQSDGQTQHNLFNDAAGGLDAPVAEKIRS